MPPSGRRPSARAPQPARELPPQEELPPPPRVPGGPLLRPEASGDSYPSAHFPAAPEGRAPSGHITVPHELTRQGKRAAAGAGLTWPGRSATSLADGGRRSPLKTPRVPGGWGSACASRLRDPGHRAARASRSVKPRRRAAPRPLPTQEHRSRWRVAGRAPTSARGPHGARVGWSPPRMLQKALGRSAGLSFFRAQQFPFYHILLIKPPGNVNLT